MFFVILGIIVVLILAIVLSSIKVVHTGNVMILERFGLYYKTLEPGWHVTIPFVDFAKTRISMKQQILDIQPQTVITKDNVNISVDTLFSIRS